MKVYRKFQPEYMNTLINPGPNGGGQLLMLLAELKAEPGKASTAANNREAHACALVNEGTSAGTFVRYDFMYTTEAEKHQA